MKPFRTYLIATFILVAMLFYMLRYQYQVPILMYHSVDRSDKNNALAVSPETFERQMEFLKLHNYNVIALSTLIEKIKRSENIAPNTVVITFDDGYLDNFKYAFPVLKKMDFPATIFMISDNIGLPGWLAEEDLKILNSSGVEIGSHTVTHAFLPDLHRDEIKKQLEQSKARLEAVLGRGVNMFSYPAGGVTDEAQELVKKAGYDGAVTTNYQAARNDPYRLRRIKIKDSAGNLFGFWIKTTGFYHLGKKRVKANPH